MAETIVLDSEQKRRYCNTMLSQLDLDGTQTVVFKKTAKDSTAKQQRLQWLWYTEVANSGLGQDDIKEDVHIRAKWQFARPILVRDDENFRELYHTIVNTYKGTEKYAEICRYTADNFISTEKMDIKQRAEYLTEFERFWRDKGVYLTDPALQGVDLSKF